MAVNGPRKQLALDTNLLMNLADDQEFAHDFREQFQKAGYALRLCATVLGELVAVELEGDKRERELAEIALNDIVEWQIRAFDLTSIEQAIAEQFARRVLRTGLLPDEERHDALLLAEASTAEIPLLVTSDKHLLDIDEDALLLVFNAADLLPVHPVHPARLLQALR